LLISFHILCFVSRNSRTSIITHCLNFLFLRKRQEVCKSGHNERVQKTRALYSRGGRWGFYIGATSRDCSWLDSCFCSYLCLCTCGWFCVSEPKGGRQTAGLGSWIYRRDAPIREACQGSYFMYFRSRKELSV